MRRPSGSPARATAQVDILYAQAQIFIWKQRRCFGYRFQAGQATTPQPCIVVRPCISLHSCQALRRRLHTGLDDSPTLNIRFSNLFGTRARCTVGWLCIYAKAGNLSPLRICPSLLFRHLPGIDTQTHTSRTLCSSKQWGLAAACYPLACTANLLFWGQPAWCVTCVWHLPRLFCHRQRA